VTRWGAAGSRACCCEGRGAWHLAPWRGKEAIREAGRRVVAIVDTELVGNVLGDCGGGQDMDPGAKKTWYVRRGVICEVREIKAKNGLRSSLHPVQCVCSGEITPI